MSTDVVEVVETNSETSLDEPIFSHIVERDPENTAHAKILKARIEGTPVTALCGYVWVPSRDPERHPVCPKCLEIFEFTLDLKS